MKKNDSMSQVNLKLAFDFFDDVMAQNEPSRTTTG